jgi:organic hydroperoxide reductase OsmC/OhrA
MQRDGIRQSCWLPRFPPVISSGNLHLCADAGIVVVAYSDDASGVEIERADGAGQFESVTLRPHAKLAAGSNENIARRLHDAAAEKCFIARSVSFKVEHEPTFEIAST